MSIVRGALVVTALLGLSGCEREKLTASPAPAAPAGERPALWSIEVLNGEKVASRLDICADSAVRASFVRPAPEVGGQPCVRVSAPRETLSDYSARCRVDNDLYAVSSGTTGDLARDFTVEMAVTRQGQTQPTYEQVRRYRLLGGCPTGWHIGDAAAPGEKQLLDTISGKRRPMPPSPN